MTSLKSLASERRHDLFPVITAGSGLSLPLMDGVTKRGFATMTDPAGAKNKSRLPWWNKALFGIAAVITFALAIWSLYLGRASTGAIAAALSLAFVLLLHLPVVESFEVLTLKVKLKSQVDEAHELMNRLQRNAAIGSKLMYIQLAFMNRIGSISWRRKRELMHEIDQMLNVLGISHEEVSAWKRPFLNIISFDLFRIFEVSWRQLVSDGLSKANMKVSSYTAGRTVDPNDAEYQRLIAEANRFAFQQPSLEDVLFEPRLENLESFTASRIANAPLTDAERAQIEIIRREVVDLSKSCWADGTITSEAENYLEKYGEYTRTRLEELQQVGR